MAAETRQTRRVTIGALFILGLIGMAVLIFFLEDIVRAFERNYELVALVPDAPGIAQRTPVWVGGRRVGEVRSVAILPTSLDTLGRVAVTMELPLRVRPQIRADSRVRITALNLMSEAVVDIIPGSAHTPPLAEGDTLRLEARPTAQQLTAQAELVRGELDTVLATLRTLAPAARTRLDESQRLAAGFQAAMAEAQRLRADLDRNEGLAALRDPAFRASLDRARARTAELPGLLAQLHARSGPAAEVRAALARLQSRADTLAAQLDAAAALLDEPVGFVGRVQQDTALARALTATRAALDSLVVEARRNPLRFVF